MIAVNTRLKKLTDLLIRQYLRIGVAEADELLPAADNYDTWFRTQALVAIERGLIVEKGHYTEKGGPNAITAAGRLVETAASKYILQPVTDWTLQHFVGFWREGYGLWRLNREMLLLPTPAKIITVKPEMDRIAGYQRAEISAWLGHIAKHRRHVERFVHAATVQGWTQQQFLENMTAPDGHIVGFRYGNADLSWHEHLRRYTVGRPHILAAAAVEWRMKFAATGRA